MYESESSFEKSTFFVVIVVVRISHVFCPFLCCFPIRRTQIGHWFWATSQHLQPTTIIMSSIPTRNGESISRWQVTARMPRRFSHVYPADAKTARKGERWAGTRNPCPNHRMRCRVKLPRSKSDYQDLVMLTYRTHPMPWKRQRSNTESHRASSMRSGQISQTQNKYCIEHLKKSNITAALQVLQPCEDRCGFHCSL